MESNSLFYSLEFVAGSGDTLNIEQRTALQTSFVIMKKNYKFNRVLFWGKIRCLNGDYFIAQGRGEDEMKDKMNLYSFNCMDWFLLPPATDSMMEEVSRAAGGFFTGDPSFVYEHVEIRQRADGDEEEEVVTKVKEESRLAVTVHQIDEEVSVVPRGAFVRSLHGLVQVNRSFGGLSHSEAAKLDNFLHFRKPKNLKKKSIMEFGDLTPALDFMDVLSDDVPKGSWSLQFESAGTTCVLRSLLWLGLTFYHVPMTPQHGYVYIGDGTKNLNLPFML
ncbi:LOW QUALITY PROTEIN: radial spoke head protein 9 homolog [Xyrichtys novacula]|uniref:Radial spoke head protein 9 homolog n=1 Tax=Xyrichtys novacula TaxID=13765 RepID=A0AAV1GTH6_XYRNO|nr:LOW QUALITY PROTEIN: radial spoke head protein 9 homolog [Xyrichtys novacula]